jgi:TonB family protein
VVLAFLAVGTLLSDPLWSQEGARPLPEERGKGILEQFDRRLREVETLLAAGESRKAYKKVSRVLDEMTDRFISGPDVGRFLGVALVQRAVAAYQLGRTDEAIWHWYVARQMLPEVAGLQMTAYGAAGTFLKTQSIRHALATLHWTPGSAEELEGGGTPPRKIRAPMPELPAAKRGFSRVSVELEVIIGENGRLREPLILDSKGELTLVYATLDTLRRWEFQPAEIKGKPAAVRYKLVFNFRSE